jgi:uncharacterized membrane protein YhaH (DUF805 family)
MSIFNQFWPIGIILGGIVNIGVMFYCRKALVIKRAHDLNNEWSSRRKKIFVTNIILVIVSASSGLVLSKAMPNAQDVKAKIYATQKISRDMQEKATSMQETIKDLQAKMIPIQEQISTADTNKQQELLGELKNLQTQMTAAQETYSASAIASSQEQKAIQEEVLQIGADTAKVAANPIIIIINILGFILGIYSVYLGWNLVFKKGTNGDNQYGKDPLAKE